MDSHRDRAERSRWLTSVTSAVEATARDGSAASSSESPLVADDRNGPRVGRYWLRRELGAGGMGVVYEAYDPELDRLVAVKVLRSTFDRERLSREARALARLSHPNVVSVYDVGTFEEHAFIAMELVEGTTLKTWARERRPGLAETLGVVLQAGRGLAAAHAAGLMHRDFKPDNVMVGSDGRVRVLDFGIVSAIGSSGPEEVRSRAEHQPADDRGALIGARLTADGTLVGTPAYMSPEQLRARPLAATADQFSFCVVVWELLYGVRPFAPETLMEFLRSGVLGAPGEPSEAPLAPTWLRRVLEKGLALDTASRYPTMAALLEAIEAGLLRHTAELRLLGRRYELLPATLDAALPGRQRALDRFNGRLVTIERLVSTTSGAPLLTGAELVRAFEQLAPLRHPNLVVVLDFGCDRDGAPYLVLDLRDSGDDLGAASRRPGARSLLHYLVEVLQVLAYLHQNRIHLGVIEPARVSVVENRVKLTPIGLLPAGERSLGVAPEVAAGAAPSVAGDLYSFAIFALQCLRPPGAPIDLGAAPESALAAWNLEPRVSAVLSRLLASDPSQRYAAAEDVARALDDAAWQALSAETLEVRESRLRAAPFLGRSDELARLEASIREARAGRGAAWLVSGESGAGKSRLLDEVARLGTVHGAVVLRGQEEREGGSPYRLFRDVLHALALLTDLDEIEASVLLPAVPNLSETLGREVRPAPELDSRSTHARLLEIVQQILVRQQQPILMLLEDVQWARSDSLDLLKRMASGVAQLPLLIVATVRDDEPLDFQEALAGLWPMRLGRLDESAIAEVAETVIGPLGRAPALLRLLQRESEGNAFFLVEVIRALAEKFGGLARIGETELPETVFAGGVQSLVRERLRAVSGDARTLLVAAAIIGRRLEPDLLARLLPELDLPDCIEKCVEAAILERRGEAIRFRHDKLREGTLAALSDAEKRELHERVALSMELEYPGDPERYAALAHHFGQAANREKETHYARLAGEYALLHGAVREAIELLEKARSGLARGSDPLVLGGVCVMLSDAYYFMTDMRSAMAYAAHGGRAVGFRFPSGNLQRVGALFWQLLLHVIYRLAPRFAAAGDEAGRAANRVASIAAGCAAVVSISLADAPGVLFFSLMAWNAAERARYPDPWAAGILGYGLASLGLPGLARSYFASTGRGGRAIEGSYPVLKTSFLLGTAQIAAAEALIREELEIVRRSGFKPAETFNWFLLGYCAYYRGRLDEAEDSFTRAVAHEGTRANFAPGLALVRCMKGRLDEARSLLRESLDPAQPAAPRSIALGVLALIHARSGETDAALRSADSAVALAARTTTFGYAGAAFFTGVFEVYSGELERARREGRSAAPALRSLRRVLRHGRAWSRAFGVGRPLWLFYRAKVEWLRQRPQRAERLWRKSQELAQRLDLGLYVTLAARELEATSSVPAAERRSRASSAK